MGAQTEQIMVSIANEFHGCATRVRIPRLPYTLSRSQARRVFRGNCGMATCKCGAIRDGGDWHHEAIETGELVDVERVPEHGETGDWYETLRISKEV